MNSMSRLGISQLKRLKKKISLRKKFMKDTYTTLEIKRYKTFIF